MMQFSRATVADVLRSAQRDEAFIKELQDGLQGLAKVCGIRQYHAAHRIVPKVANAWYYFLTTLGGLQTLGEEYTGTLRCDNEKKIPSKQVELIWLLLYMGGEPLYDRLIDSFQNKVQSSNELTPQAQTLFLKILNFLSNHKNTLKRIHHSLFYIDGKFYNISNRIMGIKYVLTREWLRDNTFTQSFKLLGYVSLFYIIFDFIQQIWSSSGSGSVVENITLKGDVDAKRGCILCADSRKNPCATPCGHVFCWDCICDSLKYQHNCPICREVVLPSRIIFLQNYL